MMEILLLALAFCYKATVQHIKLGLAAVLFVSSLIGYFLLRWIWRKLKQAYEDLPLEIKVALSVALVLCIYEQRALVYSTASTSTILVRKHMPWVAEHIQWGLARLAELVAVAWTAASSTDNTSAAGAEANSTAAAAVAAET